MRVKEESEKAGLKPNIHETEIMASSPITSWKIEVEKVETVADFIFSGSKIIADSDCSHEIKRHLFLGRKAMTNLCYLVAQWCLILYDLMDCSIPGFPVLHYVPDFGQTHVYLINDAIQPSHPLSPPSPPALSLS